MTSIITSMKQRQNLGLGTRSQINSTINQMNQITKQNASSSEQLAATAEEMMGQAEQLIMLVGFFNTDQDATRSKSASTPSHDHQPSKSNNGPKRVDVSRLNEAKFERFREIFYTSPLKIQNSNSG